MRIPKFASLCCASVCLVSALAMPLAVRADGPGFNPPVVGVPAATDQWTNCGPWQQIGTTGIYWTWHRQKSASDGNYQISWYFYNGYGSKADITYLVKDETGQNVASLQEEHVQPGATVGGAGIGDDGFSTHPDRMNISITHLVIGDTVVVGDKASSGGGGGGGIVLVPASGNGSAPSSGTPAGAWSDWQPLSGGQPGQFRARTNSDGTVDQEIKNTSILPMQFVFKVSASAPADGPYILQPGETHLLHNAPSFLVQVSNPGTAISAAAPSAGAAPNSSQPQGNSTNAGKTGSLPLAIPGRTLTGSVAGDQRVANFVAKLITGDTSPEHEQAEQAKKEHYESLWYYSHRNYEQAKAKALNSISLDEGHHETWTSLAVALAAEGYYDDAEKCYEKVRDWHDGSGKRDDANWTNKGELDLTLGRYEEAEKDYRATLKWNSLPFPVYTYMGLAQAELFEGKLDDCLKDCNKLKKHKESEYWAPMLESYVLARQGKVEEAKAAAKQAIEDYDKHLIVNHDIGYAFVFNDYTLYGQMLEELGDLKGAEDQYNKALLRDPTRYSANQNVERIKQKLGESSPAAPAAQLSASSPAASTPAASSEYRPGLQFSAASSTSGVWSYGWAKALDGPFQANSEFSVSPDKVSIWRSGSNTASVQFNGSGNDFPYAGNGVFPRGQIALHPGSGGAVAILRLTAPADGQYVIQGRFFGLNPAGSTTDAHIVISGGSFFDASITGSGSASVHDFHIEKRLKKGQAVDFIADNGSNKSSEIDLTGLDLTVTVAP